MEKILYDLMDWAGIEELVYSEASDPGRLLGEHVIKEGLLIQAFLPNAEKVSVKIGEEQFPMEMTDENGFFAVLLDDRRELVPYHFCITYTDGDNEEIIDPYSYQFHTAFTEEEVRKFSVGIYYDSYEKFGAHPAVEAGIEGVHFAVWAPDAMRVSVVGDFNFWDGRRHQMKKRGPSGIYEIFIPNLKPGAIYKYEIKTKAGLPMLKADPYGNYAELRPNTASVVWDMSGYKWNDDEWIKEREAAKDRLKDSPMSIYEVHLGSWMQKTVAQNENGKDINGSQFYNYREIAEKLAAYVSPLASSSNGFRSPCAATWTPRSLPPATRRSRRSGRTVSLAAAGPSAMPCSWSGDPRSGTASVMHWWRFAIRPGSPTIRTLPAEHRSSSAAWWSTPSTPAVSATR